MDGCLPRPACVLAVCCADSRSPSCLQCELPGQPLKGLFLPCALFLDTQALICLGQQHASAVGSPCTTPWDHLWYLAEGECDCACPQVVPVLSPGGHSLGFR